VLPRRCMKVRYDGLWRATRRADLDHARTLLAAAHERGGPATRAAHGPARRAPGRRARVPAVPHRDADAGRDPAARPEGASMTVRRAMITRPLVRDVRAARVRRCVCQAADLAGRTGPRRPESPPMTRAVVGGGRTVTRVGTPRRRSIGAALAVEPFQLQ